MKKKSEKISFFYVAHKASSVLRFLRNFFSQNYSKESQKKLNDLLLLLDCNGSSFGGFISNQSPDSTSQFPN